MRKLPWLSAAVLAFAVSGGLAAQAPAVSLAAAEDARLYAFLDKEFADELRDRPQLATQLGLKDGQNRLDDISDAAALRRLEWRRGSGRASPDQGSWEVRRYITLPGQATGYKIGMLKIVELRRKAERELGAQFDLRGFHDLLIGSGSLPLPVLERQVDRWIAARRAS